MREEDPILPRSALQVLLPTRADASTTGLLWYEVFKVGRTATEAASLIRNQSSAAVSCLNELLLLNYSPEFTS